MRVLFVTPHPWVRTLGAVRQQLELAEALEALGHEVDHLAGPDMGYVPPRNPLEVLVRNRPVARTALPAVRRIADRYDVIEAHPGALPVTRHALGLRGTLAVRSSGLATTYAAYRVQERERNPQSRGHPLMRAPRRALTWREDRDEMQSFALCDIAFTLNGDETVDVEHARGTSDGVVQTTIGLPDAHLEALAAAAGAPAQRLAQRRAVFVGYWSRRKGGDDFAAIVRETWARDGEVRFRFAGTGLDDAQLHAALGLDGPDARVEHVARFDPTELPALLADATVALLPSYVEGYPTGVVEAAAAGLATLAYDTVGTRELPRRLPGDWLAPAGDAHGFAARIVAAVAMDPDDYAALDASCKAIAMEHGWKTLAPTIVSAYEQPLDAEVHWRPGKSANGR